MKNLKKLIVFSFLFIFLFFVIPNFSKVSAGPCQEAYSGWPDGVNQANCEMNYETTMGDSTGVYYSGGVLNGIPDGHGGVACTGSLYAQNNVWRYDQCTIQHWTCYDDARNYLGEGDLKVGDIWYICDPPTGYCTSWPSSSWGDYGECFVSDPAPPPPVTSCVNDAGGTCSTGIGCGYGYQDVGTTYTDCGGKSCCVVAPTCGDAGGSCFAGNCPDSTYTDLGPSYSDCGGWHCCVPPPPPPPTCADLSGTCRMLSCSADEYSRGSTSDCTGGAICCVPTGVTINVSVFYDLNRNMSKDVGETGTSGVSVSVKNYVTGAVLYSGTTASTGKYTFANITYDLYKVKIALPAGYEVVGGTDTQTVNGYVTNINVNFPIAPIGRSIGDFITVVADGGTSAQALGTYGISGLRTTELGGNYYNAFKITQNINVADQTNRDKVKLIGIAFVDSSGTIPTTLSNLKTKANSGSGFILVYARDYISNSGLGGPVAGLAGCNFYNFCKYYYYLYFNNTWYGVNAMSTFYYPYPTASLDQTTTGMKVNVSGNNNSIPTTYPGIISIPFTTYMYKIMGSKTFATYGFMYDSDGIQFVKRQKACNGSGSCTTQ